MQSFIDAASPLVTFLLLIAVGLDLTLRDFRLVRDRPGLVAAGVVVPPLLLPPLAIALIHVVAPTPLFASSLLLVVTCPIGGLSIAYSMMARASAALSFTLTAVSSVAAVATIPLATVLLDVLLGHPSRYSAPMTLLVAQVLVALAPPVAAGMVLRARWPALADRHRPIVQGVAFTLLGSLLVASIASASDQARTGWPSAVWLAVLFVACAYVLGAAIARLLRASAADRFAFSAEFSTRNVAVALAVATALGGQREFACFAAIYLAVEIPMLACAASLHRRRQSGVAVEDPARLEPA